MKKLLLLLCLLTFSASAQERSHAVALALSVFPGAGMLYAEQPALGLCFFAGEVAIVQSRMNNKKGFREESALIVLAIAKISEITFTQSFVAKYNAKVRLSVNPVDLSPRATFSFAL